MRGVAGTPPNGSKGLWLVLTNTSLPSMGSTAVVEGDVQPGVPLPVVPVEGACVVGTFRRVEEEDPIWVTTVFGHFLSVFLLP